MNESTLYAQLYDTKDQQTMKDAADSLNPRIDRVEELKQYAKQAQIKTIGIAHCTAVNQEADLLEKELLESGFKVAKVNCKYGKVPFTDIVEGYKGVACNPAGQAQFLAEQKTQLNIMMGLCVGHDMIFNAKSAAPVTPLMVKDRVNKHHTRQHFLDGMSTD